MDALLTRLGVQAMNYAIRSGLAVTSTYAISQCSRLLKSVDDKSLRAELESLQKLLKGKIRLISPAIDLIEFKSGRGNAFLEGGVPVAKSLHHDIKSLGKRLENVASAEESSDRNSTRKCPENRHEEALRSIISDLRQLLDRIDREIPALQLAISGSKESLDTSLPPTVSPSRLLQASTFLTIGDTQYAGATNPVQIGPSFTLSLYMLFLGHASTNSEPRGNNVGDATRDGTPATPETSIFPSTEECRPYGIGEGERKPLWQEVMHKARVRLCRAPLDYEFDPLAGYKPANGRQIARSVADNMGLFPTDEFAYHLEIIEDLDDGRVHDDVYTCPYDSILQAGRRESIPVHQLAKIFYTDTGRVLNIGSDADGDNNPVLLLKRDVNSPLPTRMVDRLAAYNPVKDEGGPEPAAVEDKSNFEWSDTQSDIDRQLLTESEESIQTGREETGCRDDEGWKLPSHLDPEWLALEVFVDDEPGSSEPDDSDDEPVPLRERKKRNSLDPRVVDQIRHLSIGAPPGPSSNASSRPVSQDIWANNPMANQDALVARSPFGAITTSLSLMEMLMRLAGLQEFQQLCHLAIPDHILTFFLEETSTTGLAGEEKWNERREARRRVGFDPYTDTPTR